MELREFPCALCGGEESRPLFLKAGFQYVRCASCSFVFVSPRHVDPDQANAVLAHARDDYADGGEGGGRRTEKYRRRLERFEPYRRTGRLLEVGCREGHLLAVARDDLGWDVQGIEPHEKPVAVAHARFDLDVHCGYLESAGLEDDAFDVVYLNEVIEHIDQPLPVFHEIVRVLRPGGVTYVKTGNCESFTARCYGASWNYYAYDRIGHVSYYSPALLTRLYREVGLELESMRTWGLLFPGWRRTTSLARALGAGAVVRKLGWGTHVEALGRKPAR